MIRTSLASSSSKDCSNFPVNTVHHAFNFTQRFTVTRVYEVVPSNHHDVHQIPHQIRTQPSSTSASTLVPTQLQHHACRTSLVAIATQMEVKHTTLAALYNMDVSTVHCISRYSLGHGLRHQKLDRLKRWSGCEKVRAGHQPATNFWRPFVPFVSSTHLVLITW